MSIDNILETETICSCGHHQAYHVNNNNACSAWACTCGGFEHLDWITELCLIPVKIHGSKSRH